MPTHKEIYAARAEEYEALVSREDYQGNILSAIQSIRSLEGLDVLDLGSGTGRLACLLAPFVRSVVALDLSLHMLQLAAGKLRGPNPALSLVAAADHRCLPLKDRSADLIVSGWSVSYVAIWNAEQWREQAEAWLIEARRVLRPNGCVILLESLGTGNEKPQPVPHLENFYAWLDDKGFSGKWIRTDYRFESPGLADELTEFFFGREMLGKIKRDPAITLPECTGIWWKRF